MLGYFIPFYGFKHINKNINKEHFLKFPYKIGEWQGEDINLEEKIYSILGTKNVIYRKFENKNNDIVWVLIIASVNNLSGFHPPEICYLGSNYEMVDRGYKEINGIKVNRLVLGYNNVEEIVYYWFAVGNKILGSYYKQQLVLLKNYLEFKKLPGFMFKISIRAKKQEEQPREKILERFFQKLINNYSLSLTFRSKNVIK
jgi:EpsI family protein